jgi:uncharacterized repeat protein (TIGR01451 family)
MLSTLILSVLLSIAWQDPAPLELTAACSPQALAPGALLTCTFTVSNRGSTPLGDVVVRVPLPEGTAFEDATGPAEAWTIEAPGPEGVTTYRAQSPLGAEASAELNLVLQVEAGPGTAISLVGYTGSAAGLDDAVEGEPVTIQVGATPTPAADTATPQASPSPTATAQPSPTPSPTPSVTPFPSPSPTMTPTPTVTVVMGEIPTEAPPTATPNLSSEQVRIGTITVSIFAGLVMVVVIAAVVWVVRAPRDGGRDAEE